MAEVRPERAFVPEGKVSESLRGVLPSHSSASANELSEIEIIEDEFPNLSKIGDDVSIRCMLTCKYLAQRFAQCSLKHGATRR